MRAEDTLQHAEFGAAVLVEHDRLAVEDGGLQPKKPRLGCDSWEAIGPVIAAPRHDPYLAGLNG